MNWLSNLFATRREFKRLVADRNFWRDRAALVLKENRDLAKLMRARDDAWADRFLTSVAKTHPIAHDAERKAQELPDTKAEEYNTALTEYLLNEKLSFERDALAAGVPLSKAHLDFENDKPRLTEEFKLGFGFNT